MNKRITIKKIMLMLYALLMCLPLISVGFRSLYVTFNENAYESYYGETINAKQYEDLTTFNTNDEYFFSSNNIISLVSERQTIYVNDLTILGGPGQIITDLTGKTVEYIFFDNNGTLNSYIGFRTTNNTYYINLKTEVVSFSFYYINGSLVDNFIKDLFKQIVYNNYSYLDNAFDYSLHEFIDNNNTGLINFVGLFSDMFLGNSNVENVLYLGFANFMMNYALFISCAYFVFEVLMWFINYCRKWLYAFEEKGGAE